MISNHYKKTIAFPTKVLVKIAIDDDDNQMKNDI